MPKIQYRSATRNDLLAITNLFKETILKVNNKDYSKFEIKAWAQGAENIKNWFNRIDTHHFILAEIDRTLVGMASITDGGYLDIMYVNHQYQSQGIASNLLCKMENHALLHGHTYITSDVSITAKPFFLYKGFQIVKPQLVLCRGVVLRNYNVIKQLKHK